MILTGDEGSGLAGGRPTAGLPEARPDGFDRDHERQAVGGRGLEAVVTVEVRGVAVNGVDEDRADPDLICRTDGPPERVAE
jgi:hypothetical protein